MKKIKTTLLLLTISLLSISGFGQTQIFTDEQSFLAAVGDATIATETFDNCGLDFPNFTEFTASSNTSISCVENCDGPINPLLVFPGADLTISFNNPKNAFGFTVIAQGNPNQATLTLMTNNDQSFTVAMDFSGSPCNKKFYGIISDVDFTMALFSNSDQNDGVGLDDIHCANVPITPIPTLSQWGIIALGMLTMIFGVVMIRQRKTLFA